MSAQPEAQKQPSWWQRIFTTAPRGQYAVDEKQQVVKENEFVIMRWNLLFFGLIQRIQMIQSLLSQSAHTNSPRATKLYSEGTCFSREVNEVSGTGHLNGIEISCFLFFSVSLSLPGF